MIKSVFLMIKINIKSMLKKQVNKILSKNKLYKIILLNRFNNKNLMIK
jgi:hypothetical protein